jgi:hypothetical protein
MNWNDVVLGAAGVIGSGLAVIHGMLVRRLMVRRLNELSPADKRSPFQAAEAQPLSCDQPSPLEPLLDLLDPSRTVTPACCPNCRTGKWRA